MKTLEDMIKEKVEELVLLMQANGDTNHRGHTNTYHLDNGIEVGISTWESSNSWQSSSYDC